MNEKGRGTRSRPVLLDPPGPEQVPGPCFDFDAHIPGKMSGAPIFGARGAVIRGVVSRSFSGEDHAYGSMLAPTMDLRLDEPQIKNRSLRNLLENGNEGMPIVEGARL